MQTADIQTTVSAHLAGQKKKKLLEIAAYLSPIIIIVAVFVFAPLLIILFFSFLKTGMFGEIVHSFTRN